jgi:hypothetical protein
MTYTAEAQCAAQAPLSAQCAHQTQGPAQAPLSAQCAHQTQCAAQALLTVYTKHQLGVVTKAHMTLSLLVPCCSRSSDPQLLNTRRYLNVLPTAQRTVHKMCTMYNISNSNAPQNSVQRVALHGSAALRTANSLASCLKGKPRSE